MSEFLDATSLTESQRYLDSIKGIDRYSQIRLGKATSSILYEDPRLLLFNLSRYKFVAKMFEGFNDVLEIGCQEGMGARIILQACSSYTGCDFYGPHISQASDSFQGEANSSFIHHDILAGPIEGLRQYNGAFALDVLEHIPPEKEDLFFGNIKAHLKTFKAPLVLGMPSLESQNYASERARIGHVNCKGKRSFYNTCKRYFDNVFMFSMNDEVVHTGFDKMSQYLIALCV